MKLASTGRFSPHERQPMGPSIKLVLTSLIMIFLLSAPEVRAEKNSTQPDTATQAAAPDSGKPSTEILMKQATAFFDVGDLDQAVKMLDALLEKEPDNDAAYWMRANGYHRQKKYRKAETDYKRVIALMPEMADGYLNLGWLLIETGRKDEAWEYCRKAHELAPDSMAAAVNFGHLYFLQGEQDKAREYYRKALALLTSEEELKRGPLADFDIFAGKGWRVEEGKEWRGWFRQGFETLQEATALKREVVRLYTQGKYKEAIAPAKKVLAYRKRFLGNAHSAVATSLNNLAFLYYSTGRYDQAEPLYKKALKIWETVLGPEHPDVATALNNLAAPYKTTGRYNQAEPLYKRALKIREMALGPEHPDVAISLNNLAGLYDSTGRDDLVEPLYKRALIIRETALGPKHPDVATALNNLACHYDSTGRYDQAEPLYKRALKIREMALGATHPDVAISLNSLAELYYSIGRHNQAEPLCKRALSIALQSGNPELLHKVQNNYSYLLQKQSNLPAAIFFAKQAVNTIQTLRQNVSNLGTETLKTFTSTVEGTYKHLADMLIEQGRLAEAQQVLGMLKEEEYFQFVRRSADTAPDLKITASFTAKEQPWHIRYEKITAEAATLGNELRSLREKDAKGVLTEPEQKRLTELFDEEDKLSAAFDAFITEMVAALQQEADILRDDAARDQRIAEIGRRNLPGTTARTHTRL